MSELERPETGALTESPTLLPAHASADSAPNGAEESKATPERRPRPPADRAAGAASDDTSEPGDGSAASGPPELGPDGLPKKRRRRGSRGGRGRKKPGTGTAAGGTAGNGQARGGATADAKIPTGSE